MVKEQYLNSSQMNINLNSIIPRPYKVEIKEGIFQGKDTINIIYSENAEKTIKYLKELNKSNELLINNEKWDKFKYTKSEDPLQELKNFLKEADQDKRAAFFVLALNTEKCKEQKIPKEGYILNINQEYILIEAIDNSGLFYGIQSLRQLLAFNDNGDLSTTNLPCGEIIDFPRFRWRGFMMDSCRHFFPIPVVKKMIDAMTILKMNRFHWHLTEDQGWRIEIKKYPKLTEIGSKREGTQRKRGPKAGHDGIPYGGYYTQEELREIVKFAALRNIEVIPEIEMPGHSQAALAAYPHFGCTGGPYKVGTQWGIYRDIYCGGNEEVFQFLKDVLKEVMQIFPYEVIHIGGDEAPKDRWKECPKCQEKIKKEKLKDEDALQVYFTNRMSHFLEENGRRLMGWDEILDDDLALNAIGHYWHGPLSPIVHHLKMGRDFVISRNQYYYLDHNYNSLPLRNAYNYEPIPKELPKEFHKQILGIEAPAWSEWIPDEKRLYYQTFPRLFAYAEVAWTDKKLKDYNHFKERILNIIKVFDNFEMKGAPLTIADKETLWSKISGFFKKR